MVTYKVVDPSDRLNPLDAQLLTRSLIYHGTRSLFCKSIEEHGLKPAIQVNVRPSNRKSRGRM